MNGARRMAKSGPLDFGMEVPHELKGWRDHLKDAWRMRDMLAEYVGSGTKTMREFAADAHDPFLATVLENLFLPSVPVWFVRLILGALAAGQLSLLGGGSHQLIDALATRYASLDGTLETNATAEEILVEDDRAVGVRTSDGRVFGADVVVSAADGAATLYDMLGGRYLSPELEDRYETWRPVRPVMLVTFGVHRRFADAPWMTMLQLDHPLPIGDDEVSLFSVRVFNYSAAFARSGRTVVQVMFETDWAYWHDLVSRDRDAYYSEKRRVAGEVIARLERTWPGLAADIEIEDVASPWTMWRYTRNREGAYEGWEITPRTITARPIRTLPGLSGFYMAGQWVMPGGGVPPCLYSGRQAIQLLCHDDDRTFTGR
jgi:phytoene dehydrogenase-like protein